MNTSVKIYAVGHTGLVGGVIVRVLRDQAYDILLSRPSADLDLTSQTQKQAFLAAEKPDYDFQAAAKIGHSGGRTDRVRRIEEL